jgi:hypothetical protein
MLFEQKYLLVQYLRIMSIIKNRIGFAMIKQLPNMSLKCTESCFTCSDNALALVCQDILRLWAYVSIVSTALANLAQNNPLTRNYL